MVVMSHYHLQQMSTGNTLKRTMIQIQARKQIQTDTGKERKIQIKISNAPKDFRDRAFTLINIHFLKCHYIIIACF